MFTRLRRNYKDLVPIAFLGVILLGALSYFVLFPKAYWQSRELTENRTKWESQKISNYRLLVDLPFYALNDGHLPVSTVAVLIRQGKVVAIADDQGKPLRAEDAAYLTSNYSDLLTVSGLFAYSFKTIWQKPPALMVTYDPIYGYPATIYVRPYDEPCCKDFTIQIREFQVVP